MKKKSQIRKYTVEKVSQIYQIESIPEMVIMYGEHVMEKTQPLIQQKQSILLQLTKARNQIQKTIRQMNDGLKSRIQKEDMIVMDAKSRPTPSDVKDLTQLYTYMQDQYSKICQNNADINDIQIKNSQRLQKLTLPEYQYSQLDRQYQQLNKQCQQQLIVKSQIQQQLHKNRQFYKMINQNIEKSRKQYQIVQDRIRQQQKQLDHLLTYFKIRQDEDAQKIREQTQMNNFLENQLLKAQEILNYGEQKVGKLEIQKNNLSL